MGMTTIIYASYMITFSFYSNLSISGASLETGLSQLMNIESISYGERILHPFKASSWT